jgi:phosphohistidine swiveling domain-containing protein
MLPFRRRRHSWVLSLAEIRDGDAPEVGPKAAVLSRMLRAKLPVPAGFCITVKAYRQHLGEGGLIKLIREALAQMDADSGRDQPLVLAEIRRSIVEIPLATGLREEVERCWRALGAHSVAVRSSASAEDLPGQSFAGQYDSYLGVPDQAACLERVKECWASLWSDRAFEYRRRNGIDHMRGEMAVIVQAMVPADAAGVMFTANPADGRRDCAVIEAGFGLGPAIVAGMVTPDRLVVSKRVFRVERRATAGKRLEVVPGESGGVRKRVLEEGRAGGPCLDDPTACRLALLGAGVERLLGGPQDVEWAVTGGDIHLVQARPITALPPEPERHWEDRQIWTNANLREAAPDVVTPMTWSCIRSLAGPLIDPIFGRLGLEVDPFQLAGLIAGRLYFNVNTLFAIGKALHIGSRMDAGSVFGDGGHGSRAPAALRIPDEDLPRLRFRRHRLLLSLPGLLAWFLGDPFRQAPAILARFQERIAEECRFPWRGLGDGDLARKILSSDRIPKEELLRDGRVPLIASAGIAGYLILTVICRRWLGDENMSLAHRLLAGLGGMEDAEAGIALWRLADLADRDAEVKAAVLQETTFEGVERRLAGSAVAGPFLAAWSEFLETHGHHGPGEFEVANPRWAERPDTVLRLVRSHLADLGRADPVARARRLAEERGRLEGECLRKLKDPLRRRIFSAVLSRAQEGLRFRETIKSWTIRHFALVRRLALELGGRLARRGALDRTEDIFFLQMEELGPAAAGVLDPRPRIAGRRSEHARDTALAPPAIVFGRFDPRECAPEVVDGRARALRGIGVSPGLAAGPARVIAHPDDGPVMPGEVLVAPCTDPSWAPCFLNAAAIVIDQGGLLSHGSIVAREYGIPCVVNVGPATQVLRTGQQVEVDGGRGLVRILNSI